MFEFSNITNGCKLKVIYIFKHLYYSFITVFEKKSNHEYIRFIQITKVYAQASKNPFRFQFFSLFLIYITERILFVTKDKSNFIVFVASNIRVTLLYNRNSIFCLLREETWIDLFFLLTECNRLYIIFWIMLIPVRSDVEDTRSKNDGSALYNSRRSPHTRMGICLATCLGTF